MSQYVSSAGQITDFRLLLGALGAARGSAPRHSPCANVGSARPWRFHPTRALSVLPEPIEAVGAQLGISHRVHDVAVAQEVLQRAGVDAVVGELEAAGMPEHVRMNREGQFGQFPSPANHFEEPGPSYRPTTFGVEDEAALQVLPSQLAQRPDFLLGEWVRAIDTVFGPPHMDAAAIKLDHIPGQLAEFAGAQPMAVGDQDSRRVAVAVPGSGILETVHLLRGQIFPLPQIDVARPTQRNCPIYDG